MTLKELKQKIAESENKEWYLKYQISMNFPHLNYNIKLNGVPALYEYILKQIEGFEKISSLPQELAEIKNRFEEAKNRILSLIKSNNLSDQVWGSNLTFLTINNPLVFPYDAPETEFLIKVSQEQPGHYNGAFEYMTGNLNHTHNRNHWIGYMLAYEFMSKDFSSIAERKEAEKKSISSIRSNFHNMLGESETHLTEYLGNANQKVIEYSGRIDNLKRQKETEFVNWFNKTTTDFNGFTEESSKRINDLEALYIEKLKLEAPAQYWNKRAAKLRSEGKRWLIGMIVCLGVSIATLIYILNMVADGTMQKIFAETSTAIKWSVAFITLISFLAYGIRTFAKLTFSSFHLVRDAEEREQLTYVYLALKKEQQVDQTERHLIMQSLFSRADSGLLKDDGGPTMPGNIIDQVTKK